MNKKLGLLKRSHGGKSKMQGYRNLFIELGLDNLELIPLEQSDIILSEAKNVFQSSLKSNEMIPSESMSFIESDLLREVYLGLSTESSAYIFTDDFEYCGIILVSAKKAIEVVLNVAKNDVGHTCFLLDFHFSYFIRINYYDYINNENHNSYDIEITKKEFIV